MLEQILCQIIGALPAFITSALIPIGYIAVFLCLSIDRLSGARREYFEVYGRHGRFAQYCPLV